MARVVEEADQPLITFRRRACAIKLPGKIGLAQLLEELTNLPSGTAAEIDGVIAWAIWTAEEQSNCLKPL